MLEVHDKQTKICGRSLCKKALGPCFVFTRSSKTLKMGDILEACLCVKVVLGGPITCDNVPVLVLEALIF